MPATLAFLQRAARWRTLISYITNYEPKPVVWQLEAIEKVTANVATWH